MSEPVTYQIERHAASIAKLGEKEGVILGLHALGAVLNQLTEQPDSARQKRQRDFISKEITRLKKHAGIE